MAISGPSGAPKRCPLYPQQQQIARNTTSGEAMSTIELIIFGVLIAAVVSLVNVVLRMAKRLDWAIAQFDLMDGELNDVITRIDRRVVEGNWGVDDIVRKHRTGKE